MNLMERIAGLGEPFRDVVERLYAYLPRLLGAAVVLFIGWLAARALRYTVVRLLKRLEPVLPGRSIGLALVIGSSMVISMAIAGLSGGAIPLVLTSIGQDPAQSSSIILTTVTDVVGFFSFLGIATLLASLL